MHRLRRAFVDVDISTYDGILTTARDRDNRDVVART